MGSLFTKIFLSFWVAALLLGAALFAAERHLGTHGVDQFVERVDAHVETAAALLADEGMPAVQRWLAGMRRSERTHMLLLDAERRPLSGQPLSQRLERHLDQRLEPGVQQLRRGLYAVVRPIPDTRPPLHLAAISRVHTRAGLPIGARLAIAVVVSGLVCFALAAFLTRPVRRLRKAAQALADGDLSVRVGSRGGDELAALSRDFDIMADRVRDLLEAQRRLLRDVSHELRSPLARLRVALELARRKGDPATALDRIGREADRLEALVTDVLSLSRLEAGKTRLQRQEVALEGLLTEVVQDAAFEAEAEGKSVHMKDVARALTHGDPVLLRSAIENVLRNAVRHTPEGTTVTVGLEFQGTEAVLTVRDQGPGVSAAALPHLFDPFSRTTDARDRAAGGYGLGLAITRRAVELHEGTVEAANAPDGGLRVTLRIPARPEQSQQGLDG